MDCIIQPAALSGTAQAISSKSVLHRQLICAALADSKTALQGCTLSEDIQATIRCLQGLGADIRVMDTTITVTPISHKPASPLLDCGESGSTLRFLLPVAAALGGARFTGGGGLPARPLDALIETMTAHGVQTNGVRLPLTLSGGLQAGNYTLPGNISSQYITGLLLALPLLEGNSSIRLTTSLSSQGYIDITLDVLRQFGICIDRELELFSISGGQRYRSPGLLIAEGDWSNSACFLGAGALKNAVSVQGLSAVSKQGDRAICHLLEQFGADVSVGVDTVAVCAKPLTGCSIDADAIPDLIPVLAVIAAGARGETKIVNAARLRLKESDRLQTTAMMLQALGGTVTEQPDGLVIHGSGMLRGGMVAGAGDHRIVMAGAVASILCREPVIITGAEAVYKSYPQFFADFNKLGGNAVCRP